MPKGKRNEWHGHLHTIAQICGCSTTTVSKILNNKSEEVTTNAELIKNVRRTAADILRRDANILINHAEKKQQAANLLMA